jgi:hypothetical protein
LGGWPGRGAASLRTASAEGKAPFGRAAGAFGNVTTLVVVIACATWFRHQRSSPAGGLTERSAVAPPGLWLVVTTIVDADRAGGATADGGESKNIDGTATGMAAASASIATAG